MSAIPRRVSSPPIVWLLQSDNPFWVSAYNLAPTYKLEPFTSLSVMLPHKNLHFCLNDNSESAFFR